MNERAREVLVKAALDGVRQVKGKLTDGKGGFCAMGVLHNSVSSIPLTRTSVLVSQEVVDEYEVNIKEMREIAHRNDEGWDFLTIARKCGVKENQ